MYKVKVFVTLKEAVLDPQGKAAQNSLHYANYIQVNNMRIGKYIEFDLDVEERAEGERLVDEICQKLLVNTVVEDYRFELLEV
ncbi:MAG: phosphoribosylformylglycinamidine synthase subunit PurS [Firmicutes bacterium]|nr:phosphoribosylformylglycinamidine synthase subunit PurS [Bacillota bacterium]